jgi:hypothetical protein
LLGRIDRLIVGAPPRVLDFKLPRDPARVTAPALEREYGLQLQAYALAASRLLGAEAVRTTVVLPELGRSFEWDYNAGDIAVIAATLAKLAAAVARIDIEAPSFTTSACGVCAACRMMPDLAFTRA